MFYYIFLCRTGGDKRTLIPEFSGLYFFFLPLSIFISFYSFICSNLIKEDIELLICLPYPF